jgi:phage terminase large subunit GpA-like protein
MKKLPWFPEEAQSWTPPEELTVSQTADKYRVLSGKSAKSGPWSTAWNPVIRSFMDCFGFDFVKEIWLVKPTQSGGTESCLCMLLYAVLQDPGPALFVEPNENLATELSTERIDDMIKHCDALKERTLLQENARKIFSGMTLYMAWAGSPVSLASRAIRYLFFDECDKYRLFSGREASALKLGGERTNTFREIMKKVYTSTPVLETDVMTQGEKVCDARFRYHVFCPHCGFKQQLVFANIKWGDLVELKDIEYGAYYECASCKMEIHEDQRMEIVRRGVWVDLVSGLDFDVCMEKIKPRSVGFKFWRVHSPDFTLGDIAVEHLKSKDKPSDMMNFHNSWLAEPWAEKGETKTEFELLKRVYDIPARIVPDDTIALVAGCDPGQRGVWFTVWAWTKTQKILIDYGFHSFVGQGITEQIEFMRQFALERRYLSLSGEYSYPIWRTGMDTGGGRDESDQTMTTRAYMILRGIKQKKRLLGTKGRDNSTKDSNITLSIIDKMPGKGGKAIPGGLKLWLLNADSLKNDFSYFLSVPAESQGAALFNKDVREDFIKHILSQERQKNRQGRWEWVNVATDDHLLDATVISLAMGDRECWGGIEAVHRPQRYPIPVEKQIQNAITPKIIEIPKEVGSIVNNIPMQRSAGRRVISRGIE